jgi:branched-chain amino acid transport system ATP-binding protein
MLKKLMKQLQAPIDGENGMTSYFEIRSLVKKFGGLTAVNEFDLSCKKGSIISIIGPNGAGKTTVFNCITGFYSIDGGKIVFKGDILNGRSPDQITRMGITRTYQNIRLFANMTALENILVGMEPHLSSTFFGALLRLPATLTEEKKAQEEAYRLLEFVGLSTIEDELAMNLSYGDQRRLEIARALASKPELLLLDEPTAGMNIKESAETMHFIKRLRDELEITILLIEHDMRVVMGISERISVLDYGIKIAEGNPEEIQGNSNVIEAYLGRGAATGLVSNHPHLEMGS